LEIGTLEFIWHLVLVIWRLFRIVGNYGDNPFSTVGIEEETELASMGDGDRFR
jgi:hypothetical protein